MLGSSPPSLSVLATLRRRTSSQRHHAEIHQQASRHEEGRLCGVCFCARRRGQHGRKAELYAGGERKMKLLLILPALLGPVGAFTRGTLKFSRGHTILAAETETVKSLDGRKITSDLQPVSNFVLIKLREAMAQTAGGIIMPDQAKKRPNDGVVIGVGPGRYHPETGVLMPMTVKPGDCVMYGEYMGTKIKYNDEDHVLVREEEVLLRYSGEVIKKDTVEPVGDKVLVEITSEEKQTASGIVLAPGANKSRVCEGIILQTGPGRMSSEGKVIPMPVKASDNIKFREFGGEEVNIEGTEYMVVRANDILARW